MGMVGVARCIPLIALLFAPLPLAATPFPEEWPLPAVPPVAPPVPLPPDTLSVPTSDPAGIKRPPTVPQQVAVGDLAPAGGEGLPGHSRKANADSPAGWLHPLAVESLEQSPWGWRWSEERGAWRMHTGVDLIVAEGTPVHAARSGVVLLAESVGGYGLTVLLDHLDGWQTLYAHLQALAVQPGQRLHRGEVMGWVGATGRASTPHLHLELRRRGAGAVEALDPQPLLESPRPVPPVLASESGP